MTNGSVSATLQPRHTTRSSFFHREGIVCRIGLVWRLANYITWKIKTKPKTPRCGGGSTCWKQPCSHAGEEAQEGGAEMQTSQGGHWPAGAGVSKVVSHVLCMFRKGVNSCFSKELLLSEEEVRLGALARCLRGQTWNQWVNKAWRSNAQHSDERQWHCITNFKVAKRVDLNCSHHQKKKDNYAIW